MKTTHEAQCACCGNDVQLTVDDAETIAWSKPCPVHGELIRIPEDVQAELLRRHREAQVAA